MNQEPCKQETLTASDHFVAPVAQTAAGERFLADLNKPHETILLVEDDSHLRDVTRRILQSRGYLVFTAENAEEGIRVFQDCRVHIDLLLTDITMPGMDGRELALELARREPGLKAIFISGCDTRVIKDEVLRHNFAFLQKPYTTQALINKVREVIDETNYPSETTRVN